MRGGNCMSAWRTIFLIALFLCGLTTCLKWPNAEVSSKQPDRMLFEGAMSAKEQDRFAVANLTLQTLINTYPDSEYASKARVVLQDPRIGECGASWNSSPQCNGRRAPKPAQ
jgi:TolA-binding protein